MSCKERYIIKENVQLAPRTWRMVLEGDMSLTVNPGQFVEAAVEGCFLRRPISVCDFNDSTLTLLYDVVGRGTEQMSKLRAGESISLLTGLGNGFDAGTQCVRPLLIGGGIGCAPLLKLAKILVETGKKPQVVLGFSRAEDVVLVEELKEAGASVTVATIDGRCGTKGNVIDAITENNLDFDYFYACGPEPMLKALCNRLEEDGEISLDCRMGCGFGVCMCCSIPTPSGPRRVCKEGPVFKKNELSEYFGQR